MAINPMFLMQIKGEMEKFNARHPKLRMFFADAMGRCESGDVLEISLTKADGSRLRTNFRVTDEDKALIENLIGTVSGMK